MIFSDSFLVVIDFLLVDAEDSLLFDAKGINFEDLEFLVHGCFCQADRRYHLIFIRFRDVFDGFERFGFFRLLLVGVFNRFNLNNAVSVRKFSGNRAV